MLMEQISVEKALSNSKTKKSISDTIEFRLCAILRTKLGIKFDKFLEKANLLDWVNGYEDAIIQFGENNLKTIKENIRKCRTPIV